MYISMIDRYGREVLSLRLAVTQRCNQSCIYCHNEGQVPSRKEMSAGEIEKVIRAAASIGVKKVKITGGEPLLKEDIVQIVAVCSEHLNEVSLTTNGVMLADLALPLREAGLARLNISLDALDELVYEKITGRNDLPKVLKGMDAASEAGFQSSKFNTVVLKGLNDGELEDLVVFSAEKSATLQLIELTSRKEDIGSPFYQTYHYDLSGFEGALASWASGTGVNEIHNRMRYSFRVNGSTAVVEVVRSMGNKDFCANCRRIRVTSDGRIKPCLLTNSGEVDTLHLLRAGEDEETLKELFAKAISHRRPYWD
ncbi:MAG: GTP 3',8-cyclase MoaA [Methanomassiliicoccales archaeon]|nr:MAG: GTP 3',8-cyclase MoaA [Methanomassiliicoccales archaeon]